MDNIDMAIRRSQATFSEEEQVRMALRRSAEEEAARRSEAVRREEQQQIAEAIRKSREEQDLRDAKERSLRDEAERQREQQQRLAEETARRAEATRRQDEQQQIAEAIRRSREEEDLRQAMTASFEAYYQEYIAARQPKEADEHELNLALRLSLEEAEKQKKDREEEDRAIVLSLQDAFDSEVSPADQLEEAVIKSVGGTRVVKNAGGGDCMFLTLGKYLDQDPLELRRRAVEHICDRWDEYQPFLLDDRMNMYNSVHHFCTTMGSRGTWGDNVILQVLCELYRVNAFVLVRERGEFKEPVHIVVNPDFETVKILFDRESHYQLVI
jgi:hypothetical protein